MNPDVLQLASAALRLQTANFEGRQGRGGGTTSFPRNGAAAAIAGHFVDVRTF
jgi:3-isopropylmalate/(R)-2-methylmalate dehydratase large subunit